MDQDVSQHRTQANWRTLPGAMINRRGLKPEDATLGKLEAAAK
jgi:hypothetical protein